MDPIHNIRGYQEYSKVASVKKASEGGEKFSLDSSVQGKDREKEKTTGSDGDDGVLYEPSSAKATIPVKEEKKEVPLTQTVSVSDLAKRLRIIWDKAIVAVKSFFARIWEDKPAETTEEKKDTFGPVQSAIQSPVKNVANPSGADNAGEGKLARSTTLLTQYDKFGRISTPDVSDQQRILHGDKGLINKK